MFDFPNEQCFRFISELLEVVKSTNQPEKVLSLAVDRVVRMYRCQTCALVLIDPKTEYLSIDQCHGLSLTFCNAYRRRIATAAIGQLLWTGVPILITDASEQATLALETQLEHSFGSSACVQISVDQRTLGYLHADSREKAAFASKDLRILQLFADIAGLALVKSRLFEENLRLERVDHETGLDKYIPFLEKLRTIRERAHEFNESFSVLLLDIDNFKDTMNTFGYDVSRSLLKEMGDVLKGGIRPVDAAGRYGFDEFIVMLANTDLDAALTIARRLLKDVQEKSFTQKGIKSTVSVGVAAFPQNGHSVEDLLTTAKAALFEAQRRGRNTVHHFDREWYSHEST